VDGEKLDQVSIRVKQVLDIQRAVSDSSCTRFALKFFRSADAAVAS